MSTDMKLLRAQENDRLSADKIMLMVLLGHLPVLMFVVPLGYGTMPFTITASLMLGVVTVVAFFLLKGSRLFGVVAGVIFMLMSAVLIQAQLGRIEMHFHIFIALGFMLIYRDWLTIILPSAVIAVHHLLLTGLQLGQAKIGDMPIMVYNYGCGWDIAILHAVFVVLEASVLVYFAHRMRQERDESLATASTIMNISESGNYGLRVSAQYHNEANTALNQWLEKLQSGVAEANGVIQRIAQGDFSSRMTGQYQGDLEQLKQGVNASAHSISFMIDELAKVMRALNAGDFGVRMDQKVPASFRNLVDSAMNDISAVINDINHVMGDLDQGHFDRRVSANAQGALLSMKDNINDAMDQLATSLQSISNMVLSLAEGDLTRECTGNFQGQLNETKNALNTSIRGLRDVVANAVSASFIVTSAVEQITQGTADLSSRVQEQASALEESNATMHQIAEAVTANTSNARNVAELAGQVQNQASAGVSVMQQTIGAMQSIRESSHKISDIVSLIDGIAFQTNLLALNAAVEAARAGEHGRGFAVVAGEVRALAQKSANAAKDIKDLITDSVARIEAGTQLADKSGEMLSGITGSIEQVTNMIHQIAQASSDQATGIHQVHRAMSSIDAVTQENAALVEETTASAESMNVEAQRLRQSMSYFKTGINHPAPPPAITYTKTKTKSKSVGALPSPKASSGEEWHNF